jgi:hypothetical protein
MMVAMMIELPFAASAATTSNNASLNAGLTKPQIRVWIGRRPRRYRTYREYPRNYESSYRWVPEYYWVNGIRYVRYVRVYDPYYRY